MFGCDRDFPAVALGQAQMILSVFSHFLEYKMSGALCLSAFLAIQTNHLDFSECWGRSIYYNMDLLQ